MSQQDYCPYCNKLLDKRGLNRHIPFCKQKHNQEQTKNDKVDFDENTQKQTKSTTENDNIEVITKDTRKTQNQDQDDNMRVLDATSQEQIETVKEQFNNEIDTTQAQECINQLVYAGYTKIDIDNGDVE